MKPSGLNCKGKGTKRKEKGNAKAKVVNERSTHVEKGTTQPGSKNVVPHDIPKEGNSCYVELLAWTEGATKNVVPHDISTTKPTELDAEEIQERPMSFHTTFPGF